MDNHIVKNRILTLKLAMVLIPVLAAFLLGSAIWLLTLLGSPHANPDAKTPVIATAIAFFTLAAFLILFSIFVIPRIIKRAEKALLEYEKMKQVYEKHKNDE